VKRHVAPVYDRKNQQRLLGYLTYRPTEHGSGPWLRMMCSDPPRAVPFYDGAPMLCDAVVHYVEFEFGWKHTEQGWRKDKIMLTDSELEMLAKVREFRFPGETEEMHEVRMWHS
jgi:hypothetical protein